MGNNPVNFNDPTGHRACDDEADCNNSKVGNNSEKKTVEYKPRPPRNHSDGGFISIGISFSQGFGRDDFWTGSIDLVWNKNGQVALFGSPLVKHGAIDSSVPVINNDELCKSNSCLVDTMPKVMTPGVGITILMGPINGKAFSKDVSAYSGPFAVVTANIGEAGLSLAGEGFTSVDSNTGVPDFKTTGGGGGFSFGWGAVPLVGGGIYTVNSIPILPR